MKRSRVGRGGRLRAGLGVAVLLGLAPVMPVARAQAPASTPAAGVARQSGTVTAVSASQITLKTDKGDSLTLAISPDARVVQLAPGSTDLKSAQPAALSDVAEGDRVLATGTAPTDGTATWTVRRIILVKAGAIAQRHQAETEGWQHSTGGIVKSVDAATGTILVSSGARTVQVKTTPTTTVRRYSTGSARFEDATRSTLAELRPGDQIRVRGERTGDAAQTTVEAQEIVSGAFEQLSGTLKSVDAATGQVRFEDLRTKKPVVVEVTGTTAVHRLSPEQATRFANRSRGEGAASGGQGGGAGQARPADAGAAAGQQGRGAGGGDLSQAVARLPELAVGDLKPGDAVMVVGMPDKTAGVVALTILAGVEPILAASPNGSEMTLSPWSVGSGAPGGGTEQ